MHCGKCLIFLRCLLHLQLGAIRQNWSRWKSITWRLFKICLCRERICFWYNKQQHRCLEKHICHKVFLRPYRFIWWWYNDDSLRHKSYAKCFYKNIFITYYFQVNNGVFEPGFSLRALLRYPRTCSQKSVASFKYANEKEIEKLLRAYANAKIVTGSRTMLHRRKKLILLVPESI